MLHWVFALLLFSPLCAFAQDAILDSVPVHSVKKAMIYSAIIPGGGQVYNHRAMPKGQKKAFWKIPIIYAGLGAATFLAIQNQNLQRDLRAEYESRDGGNAPQNFQEYDQSGILTLFTTARNRRDLFSLGIGLVYLLNIADAGIEAHFVGFDVGENLNLSFSPTFQLSNGFGLQARLKFR